MLTEADELFLHQSALPFANPSSRNSYDRCFFNGQSDTHDLFFAVAVGVYPVLGIMDAAIGISIGGVQHNLRCSRLLEHAGDRLDICVGPIKVEVLEPLKQIRLTIDADDARSEGFGCDLVFTSRHAPIEEPRHTIWDSARILIDTTRMTQMGYWSGWIQSPHSSDKIQLSGTDCVATRDRSWGERRIGAPDPQPVARDAEAMTGFYWLWTPMHMQERMLLWFRNDDADGYAINVGSSMVEQAEELRGEEHGHNIAFVPQTRRVESIQMKLYTPRTGKTYRAEMTCRPNRAFYMCGIGYMSAEYGHGVHWGGNAYDSDLLASAVDTYDGDHQLPPFTHIQALSDINLYDDTDNKLLDTGVGVVEQLFIGKHQPSGWVDLFDPIA